MLYKQFPVLLQGSKYATRLPIGTRENLESFPDRLARAFYRDWYRPDLMTVVAVGDFDPKAMEASIRQRFSRIPAAAQAARARVRAGARPRGDARLDRVGQGVPERDRPAALARLDRSACARSPQFRRRS